MIHWILINSLPLKVKKLLTDLEYAPYCFDELLLKTRKLWVCFGFEENVCEHHQYLFFSFFEQYWNNHQVSIISQGIWPLVFSMDLLGLVLAYVLINVLDGTYVPKSIKVSIASISIMLNTTDADPGVSRVSKN